MKMDHDYKNPHIGNGARKMNERSERSTGTGGAGYLASLFGFSMMCEFVHPATYGARKPEVM